MKILSSDNRSNMNAFGSVNTLAARILSNKYGFSDDFIKRIDEAKFIKLVAHEGSKDVYVGGGFYTPKQIAQNYHDAHALGPDIIEDSSDAKAFKVAFEKAKKILDDIENPSNKQKSSNIKPIIEPDDEEFMTTIERAEDSNAY